MKPRNEIPPLRSVLSRELGDVQHVGQHLLAGGPQHEPDVRAGFRQELADRLGNGPVVPAAVQLLQQPQRVGNRQQVRRLPGVELQLLAGVAAELLRNPERMEGPEPISKLQEVLVVDREERPLQRREHRQLVVGPFDGGERGTHGFHFLAAVKGLAADQQMWKAARLDRIDVGARHVVAEAHEAAEQDGHVPRLQRHIGFLAVRLPLHDAPPVRDVGDPFDEGADGIGERLFDGLRRGFDQRAAPVRLGHRERDNRRLEFVAGAVRGQRDVVGLQRHRIGPHGAAERRVHEALNRRHAAVAGGQLQDAPAARRELIADVPVGAHVGAAKPVDRLLRVADDEELARYRAHGWRIGGERVVGREEQHDVRLHRVGILKFVHEDPREFLLQVVPDGGVGPEQVQGARQQVGEIERPRRFLQRLVPRRGACELLLEGCREIGISPPSKFLEIGDEPVARGEHRRPQDVPAVLVAAPLSRAGEPAIPSQIDQARLPAVQVVLPERLLEPDLTAQATDAVRIDEQIVALRQWLLGQPRDLVQLVHQPIDFGGAIQRRPPPGMRELAGLGERAAGRSQPVDRAVCVAAGPGRRGGSPQGAPDALGRTVEGLLEPGVKRAGIQLVRLRLGQDDEQGIHAGFDRAFAEQLGAEAVDGVDVRLLQRGQRLLQPSRDDSVGGVGAVFLERLAQPELELAGGLFGERDGHDLHHRRAAAGQHPEDPLHELGGLPGACGGFHDERRVEIRGDRAPRLRVRKTRVRVDHRIDLSSMRSASLSGVLRATRSSSRGPHTGRKSQ